MTDSSKNKASATNFEFSAKAMFEEIERGPPLTMTGAVKKLDTNEKIVLFSKTKACNDWVSVPESVISRFEIIGQVSCGDHIHAVVTLYLHPPKTSEGEVFLLATQTARHDPPAASGMLPTLNVLAEPHIIAKLTASPYSPVPQFASLAAGSRSDFSGLKGPCEYDWDTGRYYYPGTKTPCP